MLCRIGLTGVCSYGNIGKSIINTHLMNLLSWGCFPTLTPPGKQPPTSLPLTAIEFLRHVLTPEASIRLMMSDAGWVGEGTPENLLGKSGSKAESTVLGSLGKNLLKLPRFSKN
jgi:hypothetical protein